MKTAFKSLKTVLFLASIAISVQACKPASKNSGSAAELAKSPAPAVEAVLSSVSSVAQEVTAEPYAVKESSPLPVLDSIFMPSNALAANCVRTRTLYTPGQACTSSSLTQNLAGCTIANGDTLSGSITLTCEDSAGTSPLCSCYQLANQLGIGLSITRTGDVVRSIRSTGLAAELSSAAHLDYRGEAYGGGVKLTRSAIAATYSLDIKGIRRSITAGGTIVSDLSLKSTSPIEIGSTLGRSGRTMNGGSIQIANNIEKTLSTLTMKSVQSAGVAGCCHPSSGSATLTTSSKTTTVTFSGPPSAACGTVTVSETGKASVVKTLSACE